MDQIMGPTLGRNSVKVEDGQTGGLAVLKSEQTDKEKMLLKGHLGQGGSDSSTRGRRKGCVRKPTPAH